MKFSPFHILLIILPVFSHGQTEVGCKAGYIYYWFTDPDDAHFYADYDYPHNAFSCAVVVRRVIPNSILKLGLEVEYANRSFYVHSNWGGLGSGKTAKFSYTIGNLYIHFQPQFTFGKKILLYFYPGFYIGTLVNSKFSGTLSYWYMGNPPGSGTDTIHGSAVKYYPTFEFGISPGAGIQVPVCKNLDFIFESGFSMNLLPIGTAWGSRYIKMLNVNFEAGLVFVFPQSKKEKQ